MKRITNRILSVIMALIMLMSMFGVAASADNVHTAEFAMSVSGNVAVGEEITALIAIKNIKELFMLRMSIQYDPECIEIAELIFDESYGFPCVGGEVAEGKYICSSIFPIGFTGDFKVAALKIKILNLDNTDITLSVLEWDSEQAAPAETVFSLDEIEEDESLVSKIYYEYKIENNEVTITDVVDNLEADVIIPDTIEGYPVTVIGENAFSNCDKITSIVVPDSVKIIEKSAFDCCDGLLSATIGSGVTTLGRGIFWNCQNLETVVIKEGVTYISQGMFEACNRLKNVFLPESITTIGEDAFFNCFLLESISLPSGLITIDDSAFYLCKNLKSIDIPASVMKIGEFAFCECNKLSKITIPDNGDIIIDSTAFIATAHYNNSITKNNVVYINHHLIAADTLSLCIIKEGTVTISDCVFSGNMFSTEVTIPGSVVSVGEYAFKFCSKLNSVTICDGVQKIGDFAFYDCKALKEVTIPESITSIGECAFGYYINGSVEKAKIDGFVIYGYEDTAAEKYAKENGIKFVALCKHETTILKNTADATCTADGYTGDVHCEACDELLTIGETISKTGHTEEILPEVPATYTETGLTEGKKCSECNEILVEQEEIPMLEMPTLKPSTESITVTDTVAAAIPEMSIDAFIASVENENVQILDKDGKELANDALVGTGSKINILDKDGKVLSTYEVMVKSDVDGNGKITPADARLALRASVGLDTIAGVYETAANYDGKDAVTTSDARMILRKAVGLE